MLTLLILASFFVNVPNVLMREAPQPLAEVVSDAYYSETVIPLEENGDFVKIKTTIDQYVGWVPKNTLFQSESFLADPKTPIVKVSQRVGKLYHVKDTIYGAILNLPFESKLELIEPIEPSDRWVKVGLVDGRQMYIQQGDLEISPKVLNRSEMIDLTSKFLGLPYTWGGRSSFGYDCSGYVQMLYRQMGIYLPRDSKDQIKWEGFEETSIDNLRSGDLVFFGLDEQRIRHVGIYLSNGHFIHTSPKENKTTLRINHLDDAEWNGVNGLNKYRTGRALKDKTI